MLKNRNFMVLLLARFISNFGDSLYGVGIVFLIYSMTGSTFYTGLALFFQSSMAIVQFFLSPLFNRVNMKKYLILTQLIQAILLISIPLIKLFSNLSIWYVMIVVSLSSLINQIVYPGQLALLPRILNSEEEILKGNSLFMMAYQGSDAIFNSISGLIISLTSIYVAFYIDSVTFLLNAALFLLLTSIVAKPLIDEKFSFKENLDSYFKDFKNGLSIWKNPTLLRFLVASMFINFAATFMFASFPKYSSSEFEYSLYLSCMGLGTIIGISIANTKFLRSLDLGKVFNFGIITIGIYWIFMANLKLEILSFRIISIILYLLSWINAGVVSIYTQTMIQVNVDKSKIAVVMSSLYSLTVILSPIGSLLGGSFTEIIGAKSVVFISGIIVLFVGILILFNKNMRNLKNFNDLDL
ncbi:MAG: MFS transporter [Peptoniphilaceae bacterium]|nr:MFS transporter [Peptoniphilaceae bacterium]MDD7383304.1 MFS transporter [Peptoniphilaceae bacterium]MDY3738325.1 MFS transporter [Peptoniphilaceae bacterium]